MKPLQHVIDLPGCTLALWESLRNDLEWDRYCADVEGQTFDLVSLDEAKDGLVSREHTSTGKVNPLPKAVRKVVGDVNPVVLMGGGYCPGAVAPLLRTAVGRLATCAAAHLSIAATALPSQAEEAIEAMITGTRLEDWSEGKWRPAKPSQPGFGREADFFGDGELRMTTPVRIAE